MKELNVKVCKEKQGCAQGEILGHMSIEKPNKNYSLRLRQYASLMRNAAK